MARTIPIPGWGFFAESAARTTPIPGWGFWSDTTVGTTAEERRSASGIWLPLIPGVTPNASKDVEWRQQSAWSYSGIFPDGVGAAVRKAGRLLMLGVGHGKDR
jgi:hypothetical protein